MILSDHEKALRIVQLARIRSNSISDLSLVLLPSYVVSYRDPDTSRESFFESLSVERLSIQLCFDLLILANMLLCTSLWSGVQPYSPRIKYLPSMWNRNRGGRECNSASFARFCINRQRATAVTGCASWVKKEKNKRLAKRDAASRIRTYAGEPIWYLVTRIMWFKSDALTTRPSQHAQASLKNPCHSSSSLLHVTEKTNPRDVSFGSLSLGRVVVKLLWVKRENTFECRWNLNLGKNGRKLSLSLCK